MQAAVKRHAATNRGVGRLIKKEIRIKGINPIRARVKVFARFLKSTAFIS
jgi:hypothetical protein